MSVLDYVVLFLVCLGIGAAGSALGEWMRGRR